MNTTQLTNCLKADEIIANLCLGVFAADKVPKIPIGFGLIMNTHPTGKPGEHWLALYNNGKTKELFDSYGRKHGKYVPAMPVRLQGTFSSTCGQYCLFYLYHRLRGYNNVDIYSFFGYNYLNNDDIVTEFVYKMYDIETNVYDNIILENQICKMLNM